MYLLLSYNHNSSGPGCWLPYALGFVRTAQVLTGEMLAAAQAQGMRSPGATPTRRMLAGASFLSPAASPPMSPHHSAGGSQQA